MDLGHWLNKRGKAKWIPESISLSHHADSTMMGKPVLRLLIPGMFSQQSKELYANEGELDVSCLHLSVNVSLCVSDCILLSLAPQDQLCASSQRHMLWGGFSDPAFPFPTSRESVPLSSRHRTCSISFIDQYLAVQNVFILNVQCNHAAWRHVKWLLQQARM